MRQRTDRALATALAMLMVSCTIAQAQMRVMSLDDVYRLADDLQCLLRGDNSVGKLHPEFSN